MELFKLFGSIIVDNDKANASIHKTEKIASSSSSKMSSAFKKLGGAIIAGFSIQKIYEFGQACTEAYKVQAEAETKLETVMRQRMNATDESIQSIKNLASAQQELGVVGDEVQLAGAQQLSTFLNTDSALKTLIPAMNNLAVQQNGVNVSSQNMVTIGNLMGKAMQGQVGALTRVGITFTEAQAEVLKYGNEEERAAMLAQVITDNVGEMNQALAQTDDGKQQQVKNTLGDIQEVIGQQLIPIQTAYYQVVVQLATFASAVVLPTIQGIVNFITNLGSELQKHPNLLMAIEIGLGTLGGAFIAFKAAAVITSVIQGFQQAQLALKLFTMTQGASQIAQAAFNGTLTIGETLVALFTGKVTLAQLASAGWTAAQGALNAVLAANPIMIVVVAIGALVGAFIVAYNKCEWFRNMVDTAFNAIKTVATTAFNAAKTAIINPMTEAMNFVKTAIDKIKGFFNFKWSLPRPSIPGFHVSGGKAPWGFMGKGSLPSISVYWHAKGGIMEQPTLFGYDAMRNIAHMGGEAGPEAIAPIDKLEEYYKRWSMQGNTEMLRVLEDIRDYLADDDRWYRVMLRALSDGSFGIVLDGVEVGRIVRRYA